MVSLELAAGEQGVATKREIDEKERMELKENKLALLLEIDDEGEVEVRIRVAPCDDNGLTAKICKEIAQKLMDDEYFSRRDIVFDR